MGNDPRTFGKEAVPDGDPVGGVGGSGGTARLSSIIPLQLTGQCKHGYAAVICLGLPHAALCCCSNALTHTDHQEKKIVNLIILQNRGGKMHVKLHTSAHANAITVCLFFAHKIAQCFNIADRLIFNDY